MPDSSHESNSHAEPDLPQLIRGLDTLTLAAWLVAFVVAVGGGFKARLLGVRISLTSAWTPLAVGLLATIIRHGLERRRALHVRLRDGIRSLSPAWRASLTAVVMTRPVVLAVGFAAVLTFGYAKGIPPVRYADNEFVNLQGRFDASWYLNIATSGYEYAERPTTEAQSIVFFPAFPTALRMAGRLFGGGLRAYLFGGTVLTCALFAWALSYLFRLARELFDDDERAGAAVMLAATYPFALFYSALYSESLFLLGATAAFFHIRRRERLRAAAWGLLVGLTRPNGAFLSVALALVVVEPWIPRTWFRASQAGDVVVPERSLSSAALGLLAAATPGLGLLLYSAFVWRLTGRPLAWMEGHAAWGRAYTGLLPVLREYYGYFRLEGFYPVAVNRPYDLLNAMGAVFVVALAIPVWRRLGLPFAVFILLNMLPPIADGGFLSTGRFSAVMFPVFLYLAGVLPERARTGWMTSFMAMQAFNAALFYTWRELF